MKCEDESWMYCVLQLKAETKSNSKLNENIDWVSVFLNIVGNIKSVYCYHIEIGLVDSNGEKLCKTARHVQPPFHNVNLGNPKSILGSTLENPAINLLPGGTLTVYCRIEEMKTVLKVSHAACDCPKETTRIVQNRRRLISDLNTLMDDKANCDLISP